MKNHSCCTIFFFLLALTVSSLTSFSQNLPAYQLFTSDGEQTDYGALLDSAAKADVVFFGEFHGNPICHWLQQELLTDLYQLKGENLVFGAEFFEADDQLKIDEYLGGLIREQNFEQEARLWTNYKTDYKPLINFSKNKSIPFIATNVPRRYANLVFREGIDALDSLNEGAFQYISPLPFEVDMDLTSYKLMRDMAHGEGAENFVYAQAIKDATMAHFIEKNLEDGQLFYHINGAFHSNFKEGIIWYLNERRPDLKIMNIGSVMAESAENWDEENANTADFILSIPQNMTRTH